MAMTAKTQSGRRLAYIDYKWIALSNTTLGILMAALNGSIILIALPAIFRGAVGSLTCSGGFGCTTLGSPSSRSARYRRLSADRARYGNGYQPDRRCWWRLHRPDPWRSAGSRE